MLDAENLKIKIKTKAHENNLEPQDIMQMLHMIQCFLNNHYLRLGILLNI